MAKIEWEETETDSLVKKEITKKVAALSREDLYFLHFVLSNLKSLREIYRSVKNFTSFS